MKATPGCGSIRVWLHFELIFLSLESWTPILLLITALIHNQAHPFPMEWAGKYKTITVEDSWLRIKTGADLKVIRVHYLRIRSQTIVSLVGSFCIDLYMFVFIFYLFIFFTILYQHLFFSVFFWSGLCLYMTIDWFPGQQEHFTSLLLFSVCLFQQRDLRCGWNLALTSDPRVQRLSPAQWPQTTPGLL